mmetsp:Transcript_22976/g.66262  ORF Transcript_22976/g.66262 Transcript_22976/m.66262 type:complete len:377 (-) Transcript_22976:129-1259(-)
MSDMAGHNAWVTDLLTNMAGAETAAKEKCPILLNVIKFSCQQLDSPRLLEGACRLMAQTGQQDHRLKPIVAAIGMDLAIQSMRRFPWDKKVQQMCAAALGAGMSLYQFDVMEAAGQRGAVELVLDAQRRWPTDPSMQMGGLQGCFNDFSYANRQRWQEAGGIDYALQTIRNHYNNSEVVLQCWYVFSSGTQSPNQRAFVEKGGIPLAMSSMRDHAQYPRAREEIMQALRAIGQADASYRDQLVEAGFLQSLAAAMREVPLDVHTQSPACANVAILTATPEHRAAAVRAGAAELAFTAVRRFPEMVSSVNWAFDDQYTVYEDCLEALANMAPDPEAQKRLAGLGDLNQTVALALRNRPSSPRVQLFGQQILKTLQVI